jgi:hypothetical protein
MLSMTPRPQVPTETSNADHVVQVTLDREIGSAVIRVDLPGKGHATLTADREQQVVDRVIDLLAEQLEA